jgi:hypothetical protein
MGVPVLLPHLRASAAQRQRCGHRCTPAEAMRVQRHYLAPPATFARLESRLGPDGAVFAVLAARSPLHCLRPGPAELARAVALTAGTFPARSLADPVVAQLLLPLLAPLGPTGLDAVLVWAPHHRGTVQSLADVALVATSLAD